MLKYPEKFNLDSSVSNLVEGALHERRRTREQALDYILAEVLNLYLKSSYSQEQIKQLKIKPKDSNVIKVIHSFQDTYVTLKGVPYKKITQGWDGAITVTELEACKIIKGKLND